MADGVPLYSSAYPPGHQFLGAEDEVELVDAQTPVFDRGIRLVNKTKTGWASFVDEAKSGVRGAKAGAVNWLKTPVKYPAGRRKGQDVVYGNEGRYEKVTPLHLMGAGVSLAAFVAASRKLTRALREYQIRTLERKYRKKGLSANAIAAARRRAHVP